MLHFNRQPVFKIRLKTILAVLICLFIHTYYVIDCQAVSDIGEDFLTSSADPYSPKLFHFPVGGYYLDRHYAGNYQTFNALDELLNIPGVVSQMVLIEISGACSPISDEDFNRQLAARRIDALKFHLFTRYPGIASRFPIIEKVIGIDWEGKQALEESYPHLAWQEICDLLQYASVRFFLKDGTAIPREEGSPIKALIGMTGLTGVANMPIKYENFRDTVYIYQKELVYIEKDRELDIFVPETKNYFAVKTNLLYDAALLPNLTLEAYLGRNWSLAVEGNWSWWTLGSPVQNTWWHRIQAAGIELRKWFDSDKPLQGHALGVYGLGGTYDVRIFPKDENTTGWLSNWSWSAGLSYAYSFPIAKHFNIELGLAAGYLGGQYYDYNYCMQHEHWRPLALKNRNYWGLTRAGISIVWRIEN